MCGMNCYQRMQQEKEREQLEKEIIEHKKR
jgi:hypothetical protein